jgi:hypothetical protein
VPHRNNAAGQVNAEAPSCFDAGSNMSPFSHQGRASEWVVNGSQFVQDSRSDDCVQSWHGCRMSAEIGRVSRLRLGDAVGWTKRRRNLDGVAVKARRRNGI